MKSAGTKPLTEVLRAKRDAIVGEWLERTLRTYPEQTSRFLAGERDRFRNPVGHTIREALPALFDALLEGMDPARIAPLLDAIVRIRAVQDFTAGQAVAFVFALKKVIREALSGGREGGADAERLTALEGRIDEMALLVFDLFMKCRDRMHQIRVDEARRRIYLLERMYREDPFAPARRVGVPSALPAWEGGRR